MHILGINAYHANASAVVFRDGVLLAAAEEERFSRIKYEAGFPDQAVRYCLEEAGLKIQDIDHIAVSRNPKAHLYSKLLYTFSTGPSVRLLKDRLANVMKVRGIKDELARELGVAPTAIRAHIHHVEHHRAHIASSFFVSPFDEAACLSVDGFGDFVSTMWGQGQGLSLEVQGWVEYPHSLGILYTAVTQYLGFHQFGDEYKVMGLASYGEPEFLDQFRRILTLHETMGFSLDLSFFRHHTEGTNMMWDAGAPTMEAAFSRKLEEVFGPAREPGEPLDKRHHNIASSLQTLLEEAIFTLLNKLHHATGLNSLCLAGGVALNCVVNGQIRDRTPFERIYIQPASYDGGTSLGAAYYVYHQVLGRPRQFVMDQPYWGPGYDESSVEKLLESKGMRYVRLESPRALCETVARHIADGKVVGWFQGRMEWGPRALGNRSILVDPRRSAMKEVLNDRVKHRESFRPFAPSILEERTGEFFDQDHPSPFMLMTYRVKSSMQDRIPAVTHVDGTGRLQTVSRAMNPLFWTLIGEFEKVSGIPVVLNTSFNENEPIVCTPEEALDCFLRTKMNVLAIGQYLLEEKPR